MNLPKSTLGLLLVLGACHGNAARRDAHATPAANALPASALDGGVRVLEALAAARPEGTVTQVRALTCDTRRDPASGRAFVRVFLPLTVYAQSLERAEQAFGEIRAQLASTLGAAEAPRAGESRAWHVLGELDWDPPGQEDWVSFSDTIRLEVPEPERARGEESAPTPMASASVETYIRTVAARPLFSIGQVDLITRAEGNTPDAGLRCRIEPAQPGQRWSRLQIAGFLGALEAESPAVRLTYLEIQRSQDEPDPHATRGWTFHAEVFMDARPPAGV